MLRRNAFKIICIELLLASLAALDSSARAQTVDYFATPWVVPAIEPSQTDQTPDSGASNPSQPANPSEPPTQPTGTSNLYRQSLAASEVAGPPLQFTFNAGVDEIATDNVAETQLGRQSDLSSVFSLGGTMTADTQRLSGIIAATGTYERNIVDTSKDQFMEYGFANGQGTVIPGYLYLNANGSIDDLARLGGGLENSVAQSADNTHMYSVGGSPVLALRIGDIGTNVLRYQIGQTWFSNNTDAINLPGVTLGSLTASTDQTAREDFRMAGTILPRLMSDVSLSASDEDSGISYSGDLQRANGELINEYEITRSASLIAGGGYEDLRDSDVLAANGSGPIWDAGVRLRPNVDSSILLVYGMHDLKADFAGEMEWRATPFTDFYARYSDSLGTAQQSLIDSNAGALLGPDGAVSDMAFDQSTVVGVLDDQTLSAGAGGDSSLTSLGVPLGVGDNVSPLQSGLFRMKGITGSGRYTGSDGAVVLTAFDLQDISLTPLQAPSTSSEGATLSWSPDLAPPFSGSAQIGFTHELGGTAADVYNAGTGITYLLSDSLALSARYDFIRRESEQHSGGYTQNFLTLSVHKMFN